MSWHFSQVLVEEFSALNCLDGESCAQLKSTRTAEKSCFGDKKKAFSNPSPSGTMCEPSKAIVGAERWMSSLPASLASPGPQLGESGVEQTIQETSGQTPFASLEKSDQGIASWKTCQVCLLTNTLGLYLETWPKAGTMLDGRLYQRQKWERRIREIGSGFLPSPTTADGYFAQIDRRNMVIFKGGVPRLDTPKLARRDSGLKLSDLAWVIDGQQLKPTFVEAMMGWPIGWTALKPLGKGKFQQWLESHGKF